VAYSEYCMRAGCMRKADVIFVASVKRWRTRLYPSCFGCQDEVLARLRNGRKIGVKAWRPNGRYLAAYRETGRWPDLGEGGKSA